MTILHTTPKYYQYYSIQQTFKSGPPQHQYIVLKLLNILNNTKYRAARSGHSEWLPSCHDYGTIIHMQARVLASVTASLRLRRPGRLRLWRSGPGPRQYKAPTANFKLKVSVGRVSLPPSRPWLCLFVRVTLSSSILINSSSESAPSHRADFRRVNLN